MVSSVNKYIARTLLASGAIWTAAATGPYVLRFDNSYALVRSKDLTLTYTVTRPEY
ncbi:MAG TPA: hypothetical protein VKY56_07385 [Chloroflexota bacterium]|nr:hypothetical protein [Chloroflexota bacterium]